MNKFLALALTMTMLVFAGCQSSKTVGVEERADLERELKSVLENTRSLDSGSFVLGLNGNVKAVEQGSTNEVLFDSNLAVSYGIADEVTKLRDVLVNLLVNYNLDGNSDSVEAELVVSKKTLFARLGNVPAPLAVFGASGLVDQWVKFDLPEEFMSNALVETILKDSNLTEETEEEAALRDLYYEVQFFKEIKDHGNVRVKGENNRKYAVVYDNEAILEYYTRSAEILGEDVTEEDLASMRNVLENLSLSMEFLVSESNYISNLSGVLELNVSEMGSDVTLKLEFNLDMQELEDGFEVEVPTGAIDFMEALMM